MDEVASPLHSVKAGLSSALEALPSALVAAAAISAIYCFIRLRKSRARSLSDTRSLPATDKVRELNKDRGLGGVFECFMTPCDAIAHLD